MRQKKKFVLKVFHFEIYYPVLYHFFCCSELFVILTCICLHNPINMPLQHIKVVGFDADDTLWSNESYFRDAEEKLCQLTENYLPGHSAHRELSGTEIENLALYGYGVKAFVLSMIETASK
jgi:hypothetical protein